jgi:hypothetical protein
LQSAPATPPDHGYLPMDKEIELLRDFLDAVRELIDGRQWIVL